MALRKYRESFGSGIESSGQALAVFRKVEKATNNYLARASSQERDYIRDANVILFTPFAQSVSGARPSEVLPGGVKSAFGIDHSLSRFAEDDSRMETSCLRVYDSLLS